MSRDLVAHIGIPAFFLRSRAVRALRREGFLRSLRRSWCPPRGVPARRRSAPPTSRRAPWTWGWSSAGVAALAAYPGGARHRAAGHRGVSAGASAWVWGMVAAFLVSIPVGLSIPWLREFFALPWPEPSAWGAAIGCAAVGVVLLEVVRRIPLLARIEEPPVPERPAGDRS